MEFKALIDFGRGRIRLQTLLKQQLLIYIVIYIVYAVYAYFVFAVQLKVQRNAAITNVLFNSAFHQ